jgi:hypothetical protein
MPRYAGCSFLVVLILGLVAPAAASAAQASFGGQTTTQGSGMARPQGAHEGSPVLPHGRAFLPGNHERWTGRHGRFGVSFGSGLPAEDYDVISPDPDYPFASACALELRPVKTLHFLTWRLVPVCGDEFARKFWSPRKILFFSVQYWP